MQIDPNTLSPENAYKLLIGSVVPRPIAVVSTISNEGITNLAPFSYFNIASHSPMALSFCVAGPKIIGGLKDTLANVSGRTDGSLTEFVINVATENYIEQIAKSAAPLPRNESEFDFTGLATIQSTVVRPPRVAAARIAFECTTHDIVAVGGARIVIGEVVYVHADDSVIDEKYHINYDKLQAVGRMAGSLYSRTVDRFEIKNESYLPPNFQPATVRSRS